MIVLSVTNCPQQLRGDLTKWLMEIDTGVYVGRLNARVREKIWERVCDNIKSGQAILVYSTNNEQGFSVLTHNTKWNPVDCEGVWLMKKPNVFAEGNNSKELKKGFSKAYKYACAKQKVSDKQKQYIILDIETTGLDYSEDRIIEIGMLKIVNGIVKEEYQRFIRIERKIPEFITKLTGITDDMVQEGVDENTVICEMKEFIGNDVVLGYNIEFDINFICEMCKRQSQELFICRAKDLLRPIRRKMKLDNYRLETVAKYCEIDITGLHRAVEDCKIINGINYKLNIF